MIPEGDGWLTLAAAAELASVSYSYLKGKVAAGRLPACHPDRSPRMIRVRKSDLETFMGGPARPEPRRNVTSAVVTHPRVGARRRAPRRSVPAMTVGTP